MKSFTYAAAALAVADTGLALTLPFGLPTFALPTLALPTLPVPTLALPTLPGLPTPKTTSTKAASTSIKATSSTAKVSTGTVALPSTSKSASISPSASIKSSSVMPSKGTSSSTSIVTITDPIKSTSKSIVSSVLVSKSTSKNAVDSTVITVSRSANTPSTLMSTPRSVLSSASTSKSASVPLSASTPKSVGTGSTTRSPSTSVSVASTGRSTSASASKSAAPSTGTTSQSDLCVVTIYKTVSTTSTPIVTIPTYVNVVGLINGDDFETRPSKPPSVTITNDYTTFVSSTLTVTSTSVPPQFVDYTQTTTQYPPTGFRPVQDTLPSAGYDGLVGGPNPFSPQKRNEIRADAPISSKVSSIVRTSTTRTSTCRITTVTTTAVSVLPTRVSFSTITSAVTGYAFPEEGFTAFPGEYTTSPFTVTIVQGSPTTIYDSTTTSTYTVTAPTATKTVYAACATNNFADYIQFENGTRYDINYATTGRQIDFSFDISPTGAGVITAYDCCAYAIENTASAFLYYGANFCVALYPQAAPGDSQSTAHLCLGQDSASAQFEAVYANSTVQRIVGNGYCGQLSSSYYDLH